MLLVSFITDEEDVLNLKCVSCKEGKVSLKLSKFGAGYFFGCSRYPECL